MKVIWLGLLIILAAAGAGHADIAAIRGQGKTVWPVENRQIEMASEKVVITYRPEEDLFYADCLFILRNSSLFPQEVVVGFPDERDSRISDEKGEYISSIRNFRVWVDGQEVQTAVKTAIKPPQEFRNRESGFSDQAFVWKMNFKGWQSRTVRTTYSFWGYAYWNRGAKYVLKSGGLWKGPIGRAEIIVQGLPTKSLGQVEPGGYICKGDTIVWNLKRFEPDTDIFVTANVSDYLWYHQSERMLQKNAIESDTLIEHSYWYYDVTFPSVRQGSMISKSQMEEAKDKLLGRMAAGPLKNYFLYQDYLEKGDTAQAVTRWISSLQAKWKRLSRWENSWPYSFGLSWETERFRAGPRRVNWENVMSSGSPPDSFTALDATLNPDTGRYVRCLKAAEAYLLQAEFSPDNASWEWEQLAGKYRSVGRFEESVHCYERVLRVGSPSNPEKVLNYPSYMVKMGQAMLWAGDTTKALVYLEKAARHPTTYHGRAAADILKRISQRK